MFESTQYHRESFRHCLGNATSRPWVAMLATLFAVLLSATSGCARRAYTDIYVDNMASEIRDLEDQLYEFDNEYRVLEQELESLKAENSRLRSGSPAESESGQIILGTPKPLPYSAPVPQRLLNPESQPSPSDGSRFAPHPAPSLDLQTPPKSKPGTGPAYEGSTQPPSSAKQPGNASGPQSANLPAESPTINPPSKLPAPSMPAPSMPAPNLSAPNLPAPKDVPGAKGIEPLDLKNLVPPTIEPGEALPPLLPPPKLDPASPLSANMQDDLEIQLGQIPLPAHLASNPSKATGRLLPAVEMPSDTRIVDLKFHPSLCRAVNADGQGDDDGLYLVIQPMNEAGQFVPQAADLMIIIIDPSRDDTASRLGKWNYSAAEVKSKLQPMGSSQGVHLSMQWNGPAPGADRVVVFAYYTLPDGRRIVAERDIFVNNAHRQNTVWVPRARASSPGGVQTASGQRPAK